jgi:hypothetical protein
VLRALIGFNPALDMDVNERLSNSSFRNKLKVN